VEEIFAMLHNIKMAINWFFRLGEHATFAAEIAKFFGVWKMVISTEAGLLAALAEWYEASPFWFGAVAFATTLTIINVGWSLINKWRNSRHKIPAAKQRISFLKLLSKATAKGRSFNRETLQMFTLALRQAASVVIWAFLIMGAILYPLRLYMLPRK
jgi:hypothetical protein